MRGSGRARDTGTLPPYFNIDPDQAMAELRAPLGTEGFSQIAEASARGRQDLASRGVDAQGQKSLRLFSTWEITRYLIPVAQAHFRRVLKQNPDLPQGRSETEGGAKWFTLDEVLRLHFASEGSKAKEYRPEGLDAKLVAVANFKGGVGKTSTAAHLAMSAALDGHWAQDAGYRSENPLAQYRPHWRAAEPLLGRVPDPRLAYGGAGLEAVGRAERNPAS